MPRSIFEEEVMTKQDYIDLATAQHSSAGTIEIEYDGARVSYSGSDDPDTCQGAYVMAWVYVENPDRRAA